MAATTTIASAKNFWSDMEVLSHVTKTDGKNLPCIFRGKLAYLTTTKPQSVEKMTILMQKGTLLADYYPEHIIAYLETLTNIIEINADAIYRKDLSESEITLLTEMFKSFDVLKKKYCSEEKKRPDLGLTSDVPSDLSSRLEQIKMRIFNSLKEL